jgi:hypothetical protein
VKYCRFVLYKDDEQPDETIRLRVRAGSFGWDKTVPKKEAEAKIAYLKSIGAGRVEASIPDAIFFG